MRNLNEAHAVAVAAGQREWLVPGTRYKYEDASWWCTHGDGQWWRCAPEQVPEAIVAQVASTAPLPAPYTLAPAPQYLVVWSLYVHVDHERNDAVTDHWVVCDDEAEARAYYTRLLEHPLLFSASVCLPLCSTDYNGLVPA